MNSVKYCRLRDRNIKLPTSQVNFFFTEQRDCGRTTAELKTIKRAREQILVFYFNPGLLPFPSANITART